jgi:anti-anti-sigma regulatory factor
MIIVEQAADESVRVKGDLTESNAAEFELSMRRLKVGFGHTVTLDLSEFDVDDGVAVATAVNSIRELLARSGKLIISGAPQILGHNLYRVRMLEAASKIELVDMRLDEPSGM